MDRLWNSSIILSSADSSCSLHSLHNLTHSENCSTLFQEICKQRFVKNEQELVEIPPSRAEVWGYGLLFVLLVSLSSAIGVFFLPLMKRESYKKVLMGMVGLGVGCLCGSAILHLIPQAFALKGDTGEDLEAYLFKALVVIAAIYAFFLTERLMKLSVDHRKRMKKQQKIAINGGQAGGEQEAFPVRSLSSTGYDSHEHKINVHVKNGDPQLSDDSFNENGGRHCGHLHTKNPPPEVRTHTHDHDLDMKDVKDHPIKTVAWMVITGDGIHNFVDGLSMGAAFSKSILGGVSISIAVLCEELPHELGDLAILLNSGMSLKKALMYNFLSACTCFAGLMVGIWLGEVEEASYWIFAIAGGMFLYISLVDMLPEMTHAAEEASAVSIKAGLTMLVIQNIGMITGFIIMFVLARYGGDIGKLVEQED